MVSVILQFILAPQAAQLLLDPPNDPIHHIQINHRATRDIYLDLAKQAGIKVTFDPAAIDPLSPQSDDIQFGDISDVFAEDALNFIARATHTSWKALNPTCIYVTRALADKQPSPQIPAPTPKPPPTLSTLAPNGINTPTSRGLTPLLSAVLSGDIQAVTLLLNNGASLQIPNPPDQRTLLHLVCIQGIADLIPILLDHGADPTTRDRFGATPLDLALEYKNQPAVAVLMKLPSQQDIAAQAMENAINHGYTEIAQTLLNTGLDINAPTAKGSTYLGDAALNRQTEIVQLFLAHNANVAQLNQFGGTALHDAALGGSPAVINLLLDHSASINARDKNGSTPLTIALKMNNSEAVEALRKHGAQP